MSGCLTRMLGLNAATGVGHAYWRILINSNSGGTHDGVAELEFRATAGGANQTSGGTAIESSEIAGGSGPAAQAFDNNTATAWASNATTSEWIGYHFGTGVTVTEVAVTAPSGVNVTRVPKAFDVQYSDDGTTWTTSWSVVDQAFWNSLETRIFNIAGYDPSGYLFWRINVTAVNGGSRPETEELEFRATLGGSDLTSGGYAFADSSLSTTPDNAFDNNSATVWTGGAALGYIGYHWATTPMTVVQVTVQAAASLTRSFKDFSVQHSNDGTNWTTAFSATGQTAWSANEIRTFS